MGKIEVIPTVLEEEKSEHVRTYDSSTIDEKIKDNKMPVSLGLFYLSLGVTIANSIMLVIMFIMIRK